MIPIRLSLLTLLTAGTAGAQAPAPIQDNSFLVEEAYNQERGVVQHINTFARARGGGWEYGFTQEWPVRGQRYGSAHGSFSRRRPTGSVASLPLRQSRQTSIRGSSRPAARRATVNFERRSGNTTAATTRCCLGRVPTQT